MRDSQESKGFNPRARKGRDPQGALVQGAVEEVSIHAPVKGATVTEQLVDGDAHVSIHAPVKGATV